MSDLTPEQKERYRQREFSRYDIEKIIDETRPSGGCGNFLIMVIIWIALIWVADTLRKTIQDVEVRLKKLEAKP